MEKEIIIKKLNEVEGMMFTFHILHEVIVQEEQEKYKELLEMYEDYMKKAAHFVKTLELNSPIRKTLGISYMIKKGYFSDDQSFCLMYPYRPNELTSCFGLTIIRGQGCCRNFSNFHENIMGKIGAYTVPITGRCIDNSEEIDYLLADHIINGVIENGNLYGIDMTRKDKLFAFKDNNTLMEITTEEPLIIRYMPDYEMGIKGTMIEEMERLFQQYEEYSKKRKIEAAIYENEIKPEVMNYMESQKKKLKAFHYRTQSLKREIVKAYNDKIL